MKILDTVIILCCNRRDSKDDLNNTFNYAYLNAARLSSQLEVDFWKRTGMQTKEKMLRVQVLLRSGFVVCCLIVLNLRRFSFFIKLKLFNELEVLLTSKWLAAPMAHPIRASVLHTVQVPIYSTAPSSSMKLERLL